MLFTAITALMHAYALEVQDSGVAITVMKTLHILVFPIFNNMSLNKFPPLICATLKTHCPYCAFAQY